MKLKTALSLLLIFSICSCASKQVIISHSDLDKLSGKTLAISEPEEGAPFVETAYWSDFVGALTIGLLSYYIPVQVGKKTAKKYDLHDPSEDIAKKLGDSLTREHKMSLVSSEVKTKGSSVDELSKEYSNSAILLDVRTGNWGLYRAPASMKYRILYHIYLRLIDTKNSRVIAEATCETPKDRMSKFSKDELLANNAALLKKELKLGSEYCVSEFEKVIGAR